MAAIHSMLTNQNIEEADEIASLDSNLTAIGIDEFQVLCLGTGKGATTLISGDPSSSFAVLRGGAPVLLVDMGFGVTLSVIKHLQQDCYYRGLLCPIYITHNHSDHAAEVPVFAAMLHKKERAPGVSAKPTVVAATEVLTRLCTHRFNEITSMAPLMELLDLKEASRSPGLTSIGSDLQIECFRSQHTEICYGFVLYKDNEPLLGYSADSGFNSELYESLFKAPNVILDARTGSSYEHASFQEVFDFATAHKSTNEKQVYVTGYGTEEEYCTFPLPGITQMKVGEKYALKREPVTNGVNGDAGANGLTNGKSERTSQVLEYSTSGGASV